MDTIEFINLIKPDHDRTSCSDSDTNNGFRSRTGDSWHGRCTKCMMLQIARGEEKIPNDYNQDEFNG